jgi:hypothetical protein
MPLIAFDAVFPVGIEHGAETAVGVVIVLLAGRVCLKWLRGGYRASIQVHEPRTRGQAFSIGLLHGLAGTGAVVVLLFAAVPTQREAALALAVFAPMSAVSMSVCTAAFAWVLTRPVVEPLCRRVLIPCLGMSGSAFGLWYCGLG